MGKITFRADDDLLARLEELEASKSEAMRKALREHLSENTSRPETTDSLDGLVAERVDSLIEERRPEIPDINVNVALGDEAARSSETTADVRKTTEEGTKTASDDVQTCGGCGEEIDGSFVYCPNCGDKASHRAFCDCGTELRSDWAFCPDCGRRTPAADVLDRS